MDRSAGGLELKTGYFSDVKAFAALVNLLQDTFGIDIGLLERFGGPDPSCVPFGYFDATGRCARLGWRQGA